MTRGPGVGARGRREVYALTARNTLVWMQPTGHHAMEPLACATPDRLCGVPGHPRPVRSGWIGRSNFHRPVTPDSVRGSSNQPLERTASGAGGSLKRWSRGRSTLIVRLQKLHCMRWLRNLA